MAVGLRAACSVMPPACDVVPIINVPAVMADKSVDSTVKVPLEPFMEIALAPFG